MKRLKAAVGTAIFLVVAPGIVAGLVPWWITGWDDGSPRWPGVVRLLGLVLVVAGCVFVLQAFVRFAVEGIGTPAPVAPTERLVVGGIYRFVRNPMYLAVGSIIVGQALWFSRSVLLAYAALFAVAVVSFVRWYEEPTLARQFGSAYDQYRANVPGWWPRRSPWQQESGR